MMVWITDPNLPLAHIEKEEDGAAPKISAVVFQATRGPSPSLSAAGVSGARATRSGSENGPGAIWFDPLGYA